MSTSPSNKIREIIIIILIVSIVMNHYIKKNAFENAIDDELIKQMMVGATTEIKYDDLYEGYLICTNENIDSITITDIFVDLGLFEKWVGVQFDITIISNGVKIKTTGSLSLDYDKHEPSKWKRTHRSLSSDVSTYRIQ